MIVDLVEHHRCQTYEIVNRQLHINSAALTLVFFPPVQLLDKTFHGLVPTVHVQGPSMVHVVAVTEST